jgi:transcriptional regulator with XRE-family HTH domain
MSHFGETLTALMELEKVTQLELAERTGISRSILSRFCNGHLTPTRDMLVRLCSDISTDSARRAKLLVAHLRDEADAAHAAGISEQDYIIDTASDDDASGFVVPLSLQATFQTLRDAAVRDDSTGHEVRLTLEHLARWLMITAAELADARSRYPEPKLLELSVAEAEASADAAINSALHQAAESAVPVQTPRPAGARKRR